MAQEKRLFQAAYITLIILLAIRLVPFIFPHSRLWGVNHLIFIPLPFTFIFIILAALTIGLPGISSLRNFNERLIEIFNRLFFDSPKRIIYRLTFIAVLGLLFAFFPTKTFFLGDGYASLDNLASQTGTYIKWSERGIVYIQNAIQSLYGAKSLTTSLAAFRTISVLSGIIAIWFFFLISGIIGDDKLKRLTTFSVSLFSGILLLFFGYVENYPMLWIAYPAFIYFSLRYLKYQKGLLWAGLSLLFGLSVHLLMAVFIPAFIYLIFCRGKGLEIYKRFKIVFWTILTVAAVFLIFLFFRKLSGDLYFQNIFLPPFEGKPIDPGYFLFSPWHLIDIINIFLLLSPGILILLILTFGTLGKVIARKDSTYLLLSSIGVIGFLFVIDPTLGLGRDWDLFSLSAYPPTLFFMIHIGNQGIKSLRRLNLSFILLLILSCTPYLLTNLSETGSASYTSYLANLDPKKSLGAILSLHRYYIEKKDSVAIAALVNGHRTIFDLEDKYERATKYLDAGDVERARPFVYSISPDKYSARYHNLLTSVYFYDRDYSRALEESQKVINLSPYNLKFYYNHANILWSLRQPESSLVYLHRGLDLNNTNLYILEGLAGIFSFLNRPESTIVYGEKLKKYDSTGEIGYYFLTKAYALTERSDLARLNFNEFVERGRNRPGYDTRLRELKQLLGIKE
jgi:tetratricopeptide (TPR) repeat protein